MSKQSNSPRRSTRAPTGSNAGAASTRPIRSTRGEPPVAVAKPKPRIDAFKLVAAFLFLIGGSLLLYQPVMNRLVGPAQLEQAYANNLTAADIQANTERHQALVEAEPAADSPEAADKEAELAELFDPESIQTIDTLTANPVIDTKNVIGGIYAPSVDMKIPIMFGMSQEILLSSAGTMKQTQTMGEGNYALIGHNSTNPDVLFAPTHRLKAGHVVYITDKQTVYAYEVTANTVVAPSDIHVINDVPGRSLLTLISCTDDSKNRVVIQAELIESYNYTDADEGILNAFNDL